MSDLTANVSTNRTARLTGLLYLALVPLGFFGIYVSSSLVVPGDAARTAGNILASESLFRLGIVAALLVQVVNLFVALLLNWLLKPVSKWMARLMVIFLALGIPIAMLNELNQFAVLALLHGASSGAALASDQVRALVSLFLDLHQLGISIAGIFWGLWLFPMGYLVFRSGFLPKILGILLVIGCLGYLVDSFAAFLAPNLGLNLAIFTFWGEVLLPLWLLIKGVDIERWKARSLESVHRVAAPQA